MTSRVSGATRAVQKKLRRIVKDVLKMEQMQSILEDIAEPTSAMEFLVHEDGIDKYGDDLLSFKQDVDACCKYFAKMRGKKADSVYLAELFTSMLQQEFPEVFGSAEEEMEVEEPASSKKRGRQSMESVASVNSAEKPPKKKAAKQNEVVEVEEEPTTLSNAEKTALRAIIGKLVKEPDAQYFLFPVDSEAYPEYYEQIAEPMDLATAKGKVNEYSTVEEALGDLRLIWDNCRQFNAEGSEILQSAENCAVLLESLVEEKLGAEYMQRKKGKSKKTKVVIEELPAPPVESASVKKTVKRKRAANPNQVEQEGWPVTPRTLMQLPEGFVLSRSAMKTVVREVAASEYASPFMDPVDPDEAPGYTDLVETPMDLGTMKKRITSGMYDHDGALFVADMRLVWENCIVYNDPSSDIAAFAANLGEAFEEQLGRAIEEFSTPVVEEELAPPPASAAKPKAPRKVKEEDEAGEAESAKKAARKPKVEAPAEGEEAQEAEGRAKAPPLSANMRKYKKILKEIYKMDISLPFREPVPVDEVPGYAELIAMPMDLSTVKARLSSYDESPGKFLRDMRLIFDNCQKFNVEESELYKNAGILRDTIDAMFNESFPPVDPQEAAQTTLKLKIKARKSDVQAVLDDGTASAASAPVPVPGNGKTAPVSAPLQSMNGSSKDLASATSIVIPATAEALPKTVTAETLRLPSKLDELIALHTELSNITANFAANPYVRDRAYTKAHDRLRATKLPYVVAPDLYVVKKFGDLYPDYKCHDERYIYPIGYSCSRQMRICLAPRSTSDEGAVKPFVNVELKSTVCVGGENHNEASFMVALENGTVISEAATPRLAWEGVLGKEQQVMQLLGGKLKRCRAVFNRLAVSPDALPFLEMVPLTGPVGPSYYAIITAPMWFREVHTRLVEGTYDVEFDFAWDMRLIFKNCMEYNLAGSELYEAAERLSDAFEHLFANWVLNVQDRSVTDMAKGSWDQWENLRFFDLEDPTINICAVTGTRGPASQMLQCQACEEQNLHSLHPDVHSKANWVCGRCQEALEMAGGDLLNNPFSAQGYKGGRASDTYSTEEFGGNAFVPAPEYGAGWNQAKRRLRAGLKNVFLSPLGYEVFSREEIPYQVTYEDTVNQNLYTARAAEFQEYIKNNKPRLGAKKTARHKRVTNEPMSPEKSTEGVASAAAAPAIDPLLLEEEGRISTGKLYNFKIPAGSQLCWFSCSNEALALEKAAAEEDITPLLNDRTALTAGSLPATGFFGYDIAAIRSRIEGVEGATTCKGYVFQDSQRHRENLLKELTAQRRKMELLHASEDTLKKVLLEERWRFEKQLLCPPAPTSAPTSVTTLEHKQGFSALFPQHVPVHHADVLISLWEFMYLCPSLSQNIDVYSLHDLIHSIAPPSTPLTTYGQVVFDEVCCSLAQALFTELRGRCDIKQDIAWQNLLLVRPINIITWPQIAAEALRLLTFPLSTAEMKAVLDAAPLTGDELKQRDVLCLLFNHPLIDTFLVQLPVPEGYTGPDLNKATHDLRAMKEHFSIPSKLAAGESAAGEEVSIYASVEMMCLTLLDIFSHAAATPEVSSTRLLHAQNISRWLRELCDRWNIAVEPSTEMDNSDAVEEKLNALRAEKLNPWRFWGGYTLSNIDVIKGQLLLPRDLSRDMSSDYDRRMRALGDLERTLVLLTTSEPEAWSADDRVTVYETLVDHCIVTREFITTTHHRQTAVVAKINSFTESTGATTESTVSCDFVKHSPHGTKCHFTGIDVDHTLDRVQWVVVPPAYQSVPSVSGPAPVVAEPVSAATSSNGRGTRSTAGACVALHAAYMKVVSTRDVAVAEARKHENRVVGVLQQSLYEDPKTGALQRTIPVRGADPLRSLTYPSQPVGYDRLGNAYWILTVQEATTLFPYQPNGVSIFLGSDNANTEGKTPVEPCVLVREPNGWWGYHSGNDLPALLSSFSSEIICERVLLLKMIEKLAYTRCILHRNVLNVRLMQREWIVKRIRAEHWAHAVKFPTENVTPIQANRLLELVWGRCVEVRQLLHYSSAYKHDDDQALNSSRAEKDAMLRKQRKVRETTIGDTFELHPSKGWDRSDIFGRIRQTSATTTATRLVADSTIYPLLHDMLKSSRYVQRNDPAAPPLMVQRGPVLAIAAATDSVPVAAPSEAVLVAAVPIAAAPVRVEKEDTPTAMEICEPAQVVVAFKSEVPPPVAPVTAEVTPVASTSAHSAMDVDAPTEVKADSTPAAAVPSDAAPAAESSATEKTAEAASKPAAEPEEEEALDPATLIPDLRALLRDNCGPDGLRSKAIELLHLVTGQLVRIFPSGKDAAQFFNVSQSGISLCLHNTKPDFLGFKWKAYDGPGIKWAGLENRQLSREATLQYQVLKNNREAYNADEERARVLKVIMEERRLNPALYKPQSVQYTAPVVPRAAVPPPSQYSAYVPARPAQIYNPNMTHIIASTVQVSARFLKLKAELLTIFYMMPEKALRLPELDEAGEKAIADAGTEAAANIRTGLAKISSGGAAVAPPAPAPAQVATTSTAVVAKNAGGEDSGGEGETKPAAGPSSSIDLSQSNVERLADKAARKAKRRMRRKLSMDKFLTDVQTATTPQQLLDVVINLEGALPQGMVYKYCRQQLPLRADTLAELAVRLYALDRSIAYDEIKGVENNFAQCSFRLRSQFFPRCMQSATCNRFLGHTAKCTQIFDTNGSRIPDLQDTSSFTRPVSTLPYQYNHQTLAGGARPNNNMSAAAATALANQRRAAYMQQTMAMKPKDDDQPLEEILKKLLQTRKELDIENIAPYMPNLKDISEMEWI